MYSSVYISTYTASEGSIDLIYMIDKNDIAIFRNDKCIYLSNNVDEVLVSSIIKSIIDRYNKDINDVVNILGFLVSKEYFESYTGFKVGDIKISYKDGYNIGMKNLSKKTRSIFSIDDILDKIGQFGIESLTPDERKFLDDSSKSN